MVLARRILHLKLGHSHKDVLCNTKPKVGPCMGKHLKPFLLGALSVDSDYRLIIPIKHHLHNNDGKSIVVYLAS